MLLELLNNSDKHKMVLPLREQQVLASGLHTLFVWLLFVFTLGSPVSLWASSVCGILSYAFLSSKYQAHRIIEAMTKSLMYSQVGKSKV